MPHKTAFGNTNQQEALVRHKNLFSAMLLVLIPFACARNDTQEADSASVANTSGGTMATMPGMAETPARDANQEFLRMMVDHHEGMEAMADTALKKAGSAEVRAEATRMRAAQTAEQQKMLGMLKAQYSEDKMPMITPGNASMIAMLSGSSGAAFDRQFREHVIMHHEEGITMSDQFLPRLTNAEIKQMAEKMKTDQTKEIAELRAKLRQS